MGEIITEEEMYKEPERISLTEQEEIEWLSTWDE